MAYLITFTWTSQSLLMARENLSNGVQSLHSGVEETNTHQCEVGHVAGLVLPHQLARELELLPDEVCCRSNSCNRQLHAPFPI
jgi:hypothetical protein